MGSEMCIRDRYKGGATEKQIGETLGLPPEDRLEGTLATTALTAAAGCAMFRTHDVVATRRVLEMTATLRGERPPARAVRGLV